MRKTGHVCIRPAQSRERPRPEPQTRARRALQAEKRAEGERAGGGGSRWTARRMGSTRGWGAPEAGGHPTLGSTDAGGHPRLGGTWRCRGSAAVGPAPALSALSFRICRTGSQARGPRGRRCRKMSDCAGARGPDPRGWPQSCTNALLGRGTARPPRLHCTGLSSWTNTPRRRMFPGDRLRPLGKQRSQEERSVLTGGHGHTA